MKTPEEIKKGLAECKYNEECDRCPYRGGDFDTVCWDELRDDALDLIHQLEEELERIKAERDAAKKDLQEVRDCGTCANEGGLICRQCGRDKQCWRWRGPDR